MRAVIFVNGEPPTPQETQALIRPDDLIIAADGGARHVLAAGLTPQVIIGDLDSITADDLAQAEAAGAQVIRFTPRKDETDLELALKYAAREGATEIVVLAALGGRLDQTIANLLLLTLPTLAGVDARVVGREEEAFVIRRRTVIAGEPGDIVSLIPLAGDAAGVVTEGLEWPLREDTLRFGRARGVSNTMTAREATVSLRRGMLLCIVRHGG